MVVDLCGSAASSSYCFGGACCLPASGCGDGGVERILFWATGRAMLVSGGLWCWQSSGRDRDLRVVVTMVVGDDCLGVRAVVSV